MLAHSPLQIVGSRFWLLQQLCKEKKEKKVAEEFYFFLTSNTISRTMIIMASTATTRRYVVTLLSVDARLDVLRPLTAVWTLLSVLLMELNVPLMLDSDDVMLVRVLSMLLMPELTLLNELEMDERVDVTDVRVDVIALSELAIEARTLLWLEICFPTAVVPVTLSGVYATMVIGETLSLYTWT